MVYSAEEIFLVEGFLINFGELFFAIQENEPIFAKLLLRLKGSNIIDAIIDWCNWKVLILLFRNIPPVLHISDKKGL